MPFNKTGLAGPHPYTYNPHKNPNQENIFASAEKIDIDHENSSICLRYQDGREILLDQVQIYWPDLVRALYEKGRITRQKARSELRKSGLTLKRQPGEEDRA